MASEALNRVVIYNNELKKVLLKVWEADPRCSVLFSLFLHFDVAATDSFRFSDSSLFNWLPFYY